MLYRLTLLAAIVLVFAASLAARKQIEEAGRPTVTPRWQCERIVSMAPSVSETLYSLGLGDRVVGVTRDSHYPPEVELVRRRHGDIGGYFDPNFEAILALKPDLVILLKEQASCQSALERLGVETLVVNHQTTDGIMDSFETIGRVCGRGAEGRRMRQDFEERVRRIREATQDLDRPRVLIVVDRIVGAGQLTGLQIAGDDDYIDTIIDWAGGRNAYENHGVRYPIVSLEGIMQLDPDVIIDMVWPEKLRELGRDRILKDWESLRNVAAVRNHRVYIPEDNYGMIPGPRFLELVEYLADKIHPEIHRNRPEDVEFPGGLWYDRR